VGGEAERRRGGEAESGEWREEWLAGGQSLRQSVSQSSVSQSVVSQSASVEFVQFGGLESLCEDLLWHIQYQEPHYDPPFVVDLNLKAESIPKQLVSQLGSQSVSQSVGAVRRWAGAAQAG